jgi:hypothetical protein
MAKCPRCLENELDPEPERNSYSRFAPLHICVPCGDEETQIKFRTIMMTGPVRVRHLRIQALGAKAEQEKQG